MGSIFSSMALAKFTKATEYVELHVKELLTLDEQAALFFLGNAYVLMRISFVVSYFC